MTDDGARDENRKGRPSTCRIAVKGLVTFFAVSAALWSCGARSGLRPIPDNLPDLLGDGATAGGASGATSTGGVSGRGGGSGGAPQGGSAGETGSGGRSSGGNSDAGPLPFETPRTVDCIDDVSKATAESLSYDGRWFAYEGSASVVLYDRKSGTRTELSRDLMDLDAPSISGNGDRVVFGAGAGNSSRAYVWDRVTDGFLASFLVGDGVEGTLSRDGRFLAFSTRDASFTTPPPNYQGGAVVVDLATNDRWQASVNDRGEAASNYSFASDITDDGHYVVFRSIADNLVPGKPSRRWDVYIYDESNRDTQLVARSMNGGYADAYTYTVRISGSGNAVAFVSQADDIAPGDKPKTYDLFLMDLNLSGVFSPTVSRSDGTEIVLTNLSDDGASVLIGASADGYASDDANGAYDALVYDVAGDRFILASRGFSREPLKKGGTPFSISGDGRVVAFRTDSPELAGDGGGFVTCFSTR